MSWLQRILHRYPTTAKAYVPLVVTATFVVALIDLLGGGR